MADDLKKQASEIYREESQRNTLPTSDSLTVKRLFYLAFAVALVVLVVFQIFGGFKSRPDPAVAAITPPPLIKEAPPPELLEPEKPNPTNGQAAAPLNPFAPEPKQAEPSGPDPRATSKPADPPTPPDPPAKSKPAAPPAAPARPQAKEEIRPSAAETPAVPGKPVLKRDVAVPSAPVKADKAGQPSQPAAVASPPAPAAAEISPEEKTRRESARDLVVQQKPALAQMLIKAGSQNWSAQPERGDLYQVTFAILDESTGQVLDYIWKVDLSTRSVTPLSYNARRLP